MNKKQLLNTKIKTVMLKGESMDAVLRHLVNGYDLSFDYRIKSDEAIHKEMKSLGWAKSQYRIITVKIEVSK